MSEDKNENFKKEFIKRLINFSIRVVKFSDKLKERKIAYSIIDQLVRSSGSIGANVVEAKAASSKKDYINFFQIALKSANETKYWLLVVKGLVGNLEKDTNSLLEEAKEIANIIGKSVLTLKGR